MGWHLVLLPDSIILQLPLFTSCAAGTLTRPWLLVLSGTLASTATIGRREVRLLTLMALLFLVLTTSDSMSRRFTRRMARALTTSVSPSAALVLY